MDPSGLSDCLPEIPAGAQSLDLLGIVNEFWHDAVAVKVRNKCSALSGHGTGGKDRVDGSFRKDHAKAREALGFNAGKRVFKDFGEPMADVGGGARHKG